MDATITHGAALLFAGTFPPPDGLRARTASKRRLKSRQGAAFPRRFIRPSSALAQRSAHPSFNSRLALRRLVVLAGSKTIDNEFTDDFKDVNGASLARAPLGVASRDAVLGSPDYVEPAGGAPWGALLGGNGYVEHLGAAPRGAVLGPRDDQNGSGA